MDILIGLVVAVFIVTAVYVGYYASQDIGEEGETHNISLEPHFKSFGGSEVVQNKVMMMLISTS